MNNTNITTIRTIELFAGVGGFRIGLERASNGEKAFEISWSNQWEPSTKTQHASDIYTQRFGLENHSNEDIAKVDVENIPEHDLLVGGFPCFVAGTKVALDNKFQSIEEIKVGDRVLTHKNRYKKVSNIMNQKVDKFLGLKVYGQHLIHCTENHPFYTITRSTSYPTKIENGVRKRTRSYSYSQKPIWIDAKDLIPSKHLIGININKISKEFNFQDIPLSHDFYWFIGRFLADGWIQDNPRSDRKNSRVNKVFLCCGKHETKEVEEYLNRLEWNYTKVEEQTVFKYIFTNYTLVEFFKKFGKYAHGKFIPMFIQDAPIEKLHHFIEGYRSGDGSIIGDLHRISTVSEALAYGFQNIIHKVYQLPCRISKFIPNKTTIIEGREVTQRPCYSISYKLHETREKVLVQDGKIWVPVKKITQIEEETQVYNIEVEEDESYTVQNLIVHNCQDYSVASTLKNSHGIVGKKGVLWWEIYRILFQKKEESPQYLLLENVDRLLKSPASQRGRDFAIILSSLNSLGYAVEWRVINASEYGMPQRRRRVFILAYKKGTKLYNKLQNFSTTELLNRELLLSKTFPIKPIDNKTFISEDLESDLVEITENFNRKTPKKNAFWESGYMVDGKYYTTRVEVDYDEKKSVLGDFLIDEKDVPKEFYIDDEELKKWQYQKGAKSIPRVNKKTGHEYVYSEGSMGFPDALDKPSRTIITGEGGASASRFKHVVEVNGKHRRLTPIELERLNMFPDNHTFGVTDSKRAFLMGNALVVGIVERIGIELLKEI